MNNASRAINEENDLKERIRNVPYEVPREKWNLCVPPVKEVEEDVTDVCKLIISKGMNYKRANEVLYWADKMLRELALETEFEKQDKEEKWFKENYIPLHKSTSEE